LSTVYGFNLFALYVISTWSLLMLAE